MSLKKSAKGKRGGMFLLGLGMSLGLEIGVAAGGGWWLGAMLDDHFGFKSIFRISLMFLFFSVSIFHVIKVFEGISYDDE
ncbi:hypothetical protein GW915_02055 [bacterium]|nr:hypothetical protein [bacterium]